MCEPKPSEVVRAARGGAVTLVVVAAAVWAAVEVSSGLAVLGAALMSALMVVGTLVTVHRVLQALRPQWFESRTTAPDAYPLPDSVLVRAWVEAAQRGQVWSSETRRPLPPAVDGPVLEPDRVWTAEEWSA